MPSSRTVANAQHRPSDVDSRQLAPRQHVILCDPAKVGVQSRRDKIGTRACLSWMPSPQNNANTRSLPAYATAAQRLTDDRAVGSDGDERPRRMEGAALGVRAQVERLQRQPLHGGRHWRLPGGAKAAAAATAASAAAGSTDFRVEQAASTEHLHILQDS